MIIESYSFGRMKVDGIGFDSDLIIFPEKIVSSWWRVQGHYLQVRDLGEVLDYQPEVLVIGTGYSGCMDVADEVKKELEAAGIKYYIEKSSRAVEIFNKIDSKKKVGAFHLTC
ncbi:MULTISPECIES: Mth938-like domain-containing protein [Psychrilyobacter]|uniref:Uncharacterized protein n=1 Tax=Psychrilyobacter piezotolerans TaxID=2293438 RepID=A0ABX9KHK0_9FUSO|nr:MULTISPECIES: MTH938/NDUFAF3 family protein [Psychrilyobacter]MCS5422542.1 MTH938/NDUFAF3 family protein [Psychrilyobacter sp. S5]NDI77969.1 hypothetical protein [Psychrilyobacter piezotolerans]RDE62083.1 hypothetical protein DV867_07905 [Psychrilyobacter sp. S5]REI41330.1 hypothetical protein DYH56_07905 [Psychrilyobacter piezotolerans]